MSKYRLSIKLVKIGGKILTSYDRVFDLEAIGKAWFDAMKESLTEESKNDKL